MALRYSVDEERVALGVLGPQCQDVLVGGRFAPRPSTCTIRELDDDQVPAPSSLQHLDTAAVHQKPPAKRFERYIDPLKTLDAPALW